MPSELERQEIIDFVNTTNDVRRVKTLLISHPELCTWPEFTLRAGQLNCCIISLLTQAGMLPHRNTVVMHALAYDDCHALAAYIRDLPRPHPDASARPLDSYWRMALHTGSARILNCLALFADPELISKETTLLSFLHDRGIELVHGHFYGHLRLDQNMWNGYGDKALYSLEQARKDADASDNPHHLAQYALLHEDLFHDFHLTDRYRRPAVLEALRRLGCSQVTIEDTSHVCDILYDTFIEL